MTVHSNLHVGVGGLLAADLVDRVVIPAVRVGGLKGLLEQRKLSLGHRLGSSRQLRPLRLHVQNQNVRHTDTRRHVLHCVRCEIISGADSGQG